MQVGDLPAIGGFYDDQTAPSDRASRAALQNKGRDRCSDKFLNNNLQGLQLHVWRCRFSGSSAD